MTLYIVVIITWTHYSTHICEGIGYTICFIQYVCDFNFLQVGQVMGHILRSNQKSFRGYAHCLVWGKVRTESQSLPSFFNFSNVGNSRSIPFLYIL